MKKIFSLIFSIIFSLTLIGCSGPKEVTYKVTLHCGDTVETIDVKENSKVDFDSLDSGLIVFGWYNVDYSIDYTDTLVTSDLDLYAKAIEAGTEYKITYNLNGGTFKIARPNKYRLGEITPIPAPVKEPFYSFLGWKLNGEFITEIGDRQYGDITLDAIWNDDAKYYNITYEVGEGTLKEEPLRVLRQGETYTLPEPSTKDEDTYFYGWYLENTFQTRIKTIDETIGKDITLYAQYGPRNAEHTYISFIGDSITTFRGYIPSGFDCYYPAQGLTTVEETWWYQLVDRLGYNLLMNNSYSGSYVGGTTEWAAQNEKRVAFCATEERKPDIVVIYMGTNDWAAGRSQADFRKAYLQMLDHVYNICGEDTDVFICLMPLNNYSSGFQTLRESLNEVLIAIAKEKNLPTIDFRKAITKNNLAQCTPDINTPNCHPTAYGMTQMANVAYDVIYPFEQAIFGEE